MKKVIFFLFSMVATASAAPLISIATEYVIPMGMIQSAYSEIYAIVKVVDIGTGMIAVEGIDNSSTFDGRTGHQIIFDSAEKIDEFAAILKAKLAESQARMAGT
jgi:hypothetical protein